MKHDPNDGYHSMCGGGRKNHDQDCMAQGGLVELTCENGPISVGSDSVEAGLYKPRNYKGHCRNIVAPTKSAPYGCPLSHFQQRSATLVYTWNPLLVDPSLDENDFATQLPPLISQLDSIYINECDQASLDTDPHGDWTREEKFHPLKVGDNLNDRRGIMFVSEGSESNLTLDSLIPHFGNGEISLVVILAL